MTLTIVAINLPMFEATGKTGAYCFDLTLTPEQEMFVKNKLGHGCTIDEIYVNTTVAVFANYAMTKVTAYYDDEGGW